MSNCSVIFVVIIGKGNFSPCLFFFLPLLFFNFFSLLLNPLSVLEGDKKRKDREESKFGYHRDKDDAGGGDLPGRDDNLTHGWS